MRGGEEERTQTLRGFLKLHSSFSTTHSFLWSVQSSRISCKIGHNKSAWSIIYAIEQVCWSCLLSLSFLGAGLQQARMSANGKVRRVWRKWIDSINQNRTLWRQLVLLDSKQTIKNRWQGSPSPSSCSPRSSDDLQRCSMDTTFERKRREKDRAPNDELRSDCHSPIRKRWKRFWLRFEILRLEVYSTRSRLKITIDQEAVNFLLFRTSNSLCQSTTSESSTSGLQPFHRPSTFFQSFLFCFLQALQICRIDLSSELLWAN